jgi:Bacteriophage head to tail connecting protein
MSKPIARTDLLRRLQALKTERSSWIEHYQEISNYLLPRSGRYFVQDRNKGQRRHNSIYDSTGTRAHRVLAAGMMSGMTSPARPWFRLATSDPELMKFQPVKVWLNEVSDLIHMIFQRSNTYRMLHQIYEELGGFGSGASILMPDFKNIIHHYPLTAGEYCFATNWKGEVDTLYREMQKQVGPIVKEFGIDNCSTTIQTLYNRGNLDAWVTLVHGIEPRSDRDPKGMTGKDMPWRSVYFELGGNGDKFLRESGFKKFRGLCPRWQVKGGDIYGESPAMEALGDIKQLQHEQYRKAQGIDYQTNPPLQVPGAMKNRDIERLPGGVNYVDMAGPNSMIKTAFDVDLRLDHLLLDIQDVRQRIQSSFYADLFLMLANQSDSRMTATEVAERHEEKLLMLGPVLERLQNELLDPLIELTFDEVMEAGIAPPPPKELQGHEVSVQLVSILAQAQRAIGVNGIDRFIGTVGNIAQAKPEVLDKIDGDKLVNIYADNLGVDPQILRSDEDVAALRQQRQQAAQQQQQSALLNQAADTARNLAAAKTTEPSALTGVMDSLTGYN